jgi:hypothetical protein
MGNAVGIMSPKRNKAKQQLQEKDDEDAMAYPTTFDNDALDVFSQNENEEELAIKRDRIPKSENIRNLIHSALTQKIVFESLTNHQIEDVIDVFAPLYCTAGDMVIDQGQSGDYMYVFIKIYLYIFKPFKPSQTTCFVHNFRLLSFFWSYLLFSTLLLL